MENYCDGTIGREIYLFSYFIHIRKYYLSPVFKFINKNLKSHNAKFFNCLSTFFT